MSAIYFAIPTNAGQAKISNALALGVPLKITHMAVGDGNGQPVTPDPAQTKLVRERRRAPLNALFQDPLNPAQLVAQQIIPENEGGWWIHEVGLFDESGTLIAIANAPPTYKPQMSEGSGRTQGINVVLIVSDTSAVELKIDPSVVLATRKYVDDVGKNSQPRRLITPAEPISSPSYIRLCTLPMNPGGSPSMFSAMVSGRATIGATYCPNYLITMSTRGYSGNAQDLLKHVSILHLGPGNYKNDREFFVKNNGSSVELWMQFSAYPYATSMQLLVSEGVTILPSPAQTQQPLQALDVPIDVIFTAGNKPTKNDVGLPLVNNFPTASSLEDGSQEKYAPAALTYQLAHMLALHAAGANHPAATAIDHGMMRFATEQEAIAGLIETAAVAPKQMRAAIENLLDIIAPIGMVLPWVGETPPNDRFVMVKNQTFDKAALPKLAKVFPSGQIPFDPRGELLRWWDGGRGVDQGRALMSWQDGAIKAHTHHISANYPSTTDDGWQIGVIRKQGYTQGSGVAATSDTGNLAFIPSPVAHGSGAIGITGGAENMGRNVALACIMRVC